MTFLRASENGSEKVRNFALPAAIKYNRCKMAAMPQPTIQSTETPRWKQKFPAIIFVFVLIFFSLDFITHFPCVKCSEISRVHYCENTTTEHEFQILNRKYWTILQVEKCNPAGNSSLNNNQKNPTPSISNIPFSITHPNPGFSSFRDSKTILRI